MQNVFVRVRSSAKLYFKNNRLMLISYIIFLPIFCSIISFDLLISSRFDNRLSGLALVFLSLTPLLIKRNEVFFLIANLKFRKKISIFKFHWVDLFFSFSYATLFNICLGVFFEKLCQLTTHDICARYFEFSRNFYWDIVVVTSLFFAAVIIILRASVTSKIKEF